MSLNARISHFYNRSTPLWLEVWGEHMHHGHYGADGKARKEARQAQEDLIRELLAWSQVPSARRVLDAGCGVGGSARFLARQFGASVLGLTLSEVQAARAAGYNRQEGLESQVRIETRDMMSLGPADGSFDLVWSMESAEHIADKAAMLRSFHERLEPGGRLALATWCVRVDPPAFSPRERRIHDRICRLYHLPPMVSRETLRRQAESAGFQEVETENWGAAVAPFWMEVLRSAFSLRSLAGLIRGGWPTLKGAWAMQFMIYGYRMGLIEFAVLRGRKA
jgi:tocopherol O-methyltransferase